MSFLKKHYEKVILMVFLLVFLVALVFQIRIITFARQVTDSDLDIPEKKADYHNIDFSEISVFKDLEKEPVWKTGGPRDMKDRDYTDLVVAIEAARCPHCEKIIPVTDFSIDHRCSLCEKQLKMEISTPTVDPQADADGDGIPDSIELGKGLDMNDPEDADYDLDEDGFTNYYEYAKSKTELNDPKSHPPLHMLLVLQKIKRNKLPVRLKSVKTSGSEDISKWLVHVEDLSKKKTRFWSLNQIVKIDDNNYKLTEILPKTVNRYNSRLKSEEKVDASVVTIQHVDDNGEVTKDLPIQLHVGKPVYEPQEMAYIGNWHTKKIFKKLKGEIFKVGDPRVGYESYKLLDINSQNKTVKIVLVDKDGKEIGQPVTVTHKPRIEKRVRKKKKEETPSMMGPGDMPIVPPELLRDLNKNRRSRTNRKNIP